MAERRRGRGSVEAQRARQQQIWEFVVQTGTRTVAEIADHAQVSTMTVYRDLDDLERVGQLRLQRGVVTAAATRMHEASSRYRVGQDVGAKHALATAALDLVEPGSAILLDDSSTGIPLARLLAAKAPLTVVTNYQPVLQVLAAEAQVRLISTGGEYLPWADAFMGPTAVRTIAQMSADAVFMSASAIDQGRCFHPEAGPAEVKQAMLGSARLKVLCADHTKFSRTALHQVAALSDFDVVITDQCTPESALTALGQTRVIRV